VLGVELITELPAIDGCTREQALDAFGPAQLWRVSHAFDLLLVLSGDRRGEVIEQGTQRPQHVAQSDPLVGEIAVLGLLHDEVAQQRVARVVA